MSTRWASDDERDPIEEFKRFWRWLKDVLHRAFTT